MLNLFMVEPKTHTRKQIRKTKGKKEGKGGMRLPANFVRVLLRGGNALRDFVDGEKGRE